jgi:hypothetical protein
LRAHGIHRRWSEVMSVRLPHRYSTLQIPNAIHFAGAVAALPTLDQRRENPHSPASPPRLASKERRWQGECKEVGVAPPLSTYRKRRMWKVETRPQFSRQDAVGDHQCSRELCREPKRLMLDCRKKRCTVRVIGWAASPAQRAGRAQPWAELGRPLGPRRRPPMATHPVAFHCNLTYLSNCRRTKGSIPPCW